MRMPNPPKTKGVRPLTLLFAALLVAAATAGCLGSDEQDDGQNGTDDPLANGFEPFPSEPGLEVSLESTGAAWAGENITFDATGSHAINAEIVSWRFDLGDGAIVELTGDEEPLVVHNYTTGGLYVVNLTVEAQTSTQTDPQDADGNQSQIDNGQENATANNDGRLAKSTSLLLAVHERFAVDETELSATLSSESQEHAFSVHDDASNFTASLTMESSGLLVDAEGTLRVLDPAGELVAEKEFSLGNGENDTFEFQGGLNATGEHILEVELENGEIIYEGILEVYYGPDSEEPSDDPDE